MQETQAKNRKPALRFAAVLLALLLVAGSLAGCTEKPAGPAGTEAARIRVVCTIFPAYDWVREVLGENPAGAELKLLSDSGIDLHSFQPTAKDILTIGGADFFLYVGGESDEWVDDALETAPNGGRIALNLLEALGSGAKEEETVEGMQEGHDHDDDHDHDEDGDHVHERDHDHDGGPEYDEHVWLSLRNAALFVDKIADALGTLDPANAPLYRENAARYNESLAALDRAYGQAVSEGRVKTLLFGDRFPFRYLTDDYGLDYYAAFAGCSAETEASFETIAFLAGKVDELGLQSVMTIEGTNHRIAETVVRSTAAKDQTIRTLDSMQSLTKQAIDGGATYRSIMEQNLAVLKEALR